MAKVGRAFKCTNYYRLKCKSRHLGCLKVLEGLNSSPIGQRSKLSKIIQANYKAKHPKVAKAGKIPRCTAYHRAACKPGHFREPKGP